MKAIIHTIGPNGYAVDFESNEVTNLVEFLEALPKIESKLAAAGYIANSTREYPKTPSGEPICPKHGAVMKEREKQGDTWYSHKVVAPDGKEHYCRGYCDKKSSPGWDY